MRRQARSPWPTRLAIFAGVAGAVVGWLLVRAAVRAWESSGWTGGPEFGFVVFLSLGSAVTTWLVSRRVLDGPTLTRSGWSLTFQGPVAARVADLTAALAKRGYSLEIIELDAAAEPVRPASPELPLAGAQLGLDARRPRQGRARVVLRLSEPNQGAGLGLVESEDTAAGFYDELAEYVVAALSELIPGITYKRADSALDPERADALRALLPERPSRLDAK